VVVFSRLRLASKIPRRLKATEYPFNPPLGRCILNKNCTDLPLGPRLRNSMEKKRLYSSTKQISPDELRRTFSDIDFVTHALLFGSRAQGKVHARSDYDLAVIYDPKAQFEVWGAEAHLRNVLLPILDLDDIDVDIVDLSKANEALRQSILDGYLVLKGSDEKIRRVLKSN